MDNLTHTLFALTLARTPLARAGRGTTAALVLASNAPDIDIVTALGGRTTYLAWHRGPTHSPIGAAALALITAAIVWRLGRGAADAGDRPPERASFSSLFLLSLVGVAGHILMDLPTSYGTRVLSPFDWHYFAVDWLPILDIYLLIALAAGLVFGHLSAETRRHNAAIALALMAANYGIRGAAHHRALGLVPRIFGPTLPPPCQAQPDPGRILDAWPRPPAAAAAGSSRRCLVDVAAMPTFLSPFRWQIIARFPNGYEVHEVDVLDRRFLAEPAPTEVLWRLGWRYPNQWTPPVAQAAATPTAQTFLGFSRFPEVRVAVDAGGVATVRFVDMRFVGGPFAQQPGRQTPFTVTVQVGPDGRILLEQLGP